MRVPAEIGKQTFWSDGALMIEESDALYIQKSFAFALRVR
jgi:hypothetical protein